MIPFNKDLVNVVAKGPKFPHNRLFIIPKASGTWGVLGLMIGDGHVQPKSDTTWGERFPFHNMVQTLARIITLNNAIPIMHKSIY